ncbi:hypothetical protein ACOMHN_024400 [Nucella lapillus]
MGTAPAPSYAQVAAGGVGRAGAPQAGGPALHSRKDKPETGNQKQMTAKPKGGQPPSRANVKEKEGKGVAKGRTNAGTPAPLPRPIPQTQKHKDNNTSMPRSAAPPKDRGQTPSVVRREELRRRAAKLKPFFLKKQQARLRVGSQYNRVLSPIEDISDSAACCTVVVRCRNRDLTVHNVYYPRPDRRGLWVERLAAPGTVVVGDFNVHDPLWDHGQITERDSQVRHMVEESDLVLLNDGAPTRLPDRAGHRMTAPDLSLVSSDLAGDGDWWVGGDPLSSDHLPVTITLQIGPVRDPTVHPLKFNYDKGDWDVFRNKLSQLEIENAHHLSVEDLYSSLSTNIKCAVQHAVPEFRPGAAGTRNNPWWNSDCEWAVKEKRRACRAYKRNATATSHAQMVLKKEMSNHKVAQAKKTVLGKLF